MVPLPVKLPKLQPVVTLFPKPKQPLELYICQPTPFVQDNLEQMLPDWTLPTAWVVIILQKAQCCLHDDCEGVEQEKQRLRERFMRFGVEVIFDLKQQGHLADLMDPRNGQPLLSHPGVVSHDDVTVISTLLGLETTAGDCPRIYHPQWGDAVYPSIILSSGTPQHIQVTIEQVAMRNQWQIVKPASNHTECYPSHNEEIN